MDVCTEYSSTHVVRLPNLIHYIGEDNKYIKNARDLFERCRPAAVYDEKDLLQAAQKLSRNPNFIIDMFGNYLRDQYKNDFIFVTNYKFVQNLIKMDITIFVDSKRQLNLYKIIYPSEYYEFVARYGL